MSEDHLLGVRKLEKISPETALDYAQRALVAYRRYVLKYGRSLVLYRDYLEKYLALKRYIAQKKNNNLTPVESTNKPCTKENT